jgi:hypothetical protein
MTLLRTRVLCFLFALLAFLSSAFGLVDHLEIKDDDRSAFQVREFGFGNYGEISMTINDFSLLVPHDMANESDKKWNIAFVLERSRATDGNAREVRM